MRTTLRTFAATLTAVGMLSLGSATMGQPDTDKDGAANTEPQQAVEQLEKDQLQGERSPEAEVTVTDEADEANREAEAPAERAEASTESEATSESNAESTKERTAAASAEAAENRGQASDMDDEATSDDATTEKSDFNGNQATTAQQDREASAENRSTDSNDVQNDTPPVPQQAQSDSGDVSTARDADWRTVQHRGQWWYYAPDGQWNYRNGNQWRSYDANTYRENSMSNRGQFARSSGIERSGRIADSQRRSNRDERYASDQQSQPYATGYRGEMQSEGSTHAMQPMQNQSAAVQLRYDRCGRAYICENGRAVYVDVNHSATTSNSAASSQPTPASEQWEGEQKTENRMQPNSDSTRSSDSGPSAGARNGNLPAPPAPPAPPQQ